MCIFFPYIELEEAVRQSKMEELIIPFGVGIAGYVAQTKETINITNAYEDSRFNPEVVLYHNFFIRNFF